MKHDEPKLDYKGWVLLFLEESIDDTFLNRTQDGISYDQQLFYMLSI